MAQSTIVRPALGRVACLGDLYDSRSDTFCGTTIFKHKLPDTFIDTVDTTNSALEVISEDSSSEKFDKLDVNGNFRVNILCLPFAPSGSARYLKATKSGAKTVKVSAVYDVSTQHERVHVTYDELKDYVSVNAVNHVGATHVVTAIQWGGKCIVTLEETADDVSQCREISGKLQAEIKACFVVDIGAEASGLSKSIDTSNINKYTLTINCDCLIGDKLPTTWKDAWALLKGDIKKQISALNGGKGKPMSFVMIPLTDPALMQYRHGKTVSPSYQELNSSLVVEIEIVFQALTATKQNMDDMLSQILLYQHILTAGDISTAQSLDNEIAKHRAKLQGSIRRFTSSADQSTSELERYLTEIETRTSGMLQDTYKLFESCRFKISFAKFCADWGFEYIGRNRDVDCEIKKRQQTVYVLYTSGDAIRIPDKKWHAAKEQFVKKKTEVTNNTDDKEQPENNRHKEWDATKKQFVSKKTEVTNNTDDKKQPARFVVVDCDIHTSCQQLVCTIERHVNGILQSSF